MADRQKDLFGNKITERKTRLQRSLERYDHDTMQGRLERLAWLESVFPKGGFMYSVEMHFILSEAKTSYINGQFIATVLLSTSFIEHWLADYLRKKGYVKESERGLSAMINCMRKNGLLAEYLLDKVDEVRKIRNPFTHKKEYDHPYNLTKRAFFQLHNPGETMQKDAELALTMMLTICTSHLY